MISNAGPIVGRIGFDPMANRQRCILQVKDGHIEIKCEDDFYSTGMNRKDSVAIGNNLVFCLCGHAVAAHINDATECNGCNCRGFVLDVNVAKLAMGRDE